MSHFRHLRRNVLIVFLALSVSSINQWRGKKKKKNAKKQLYYETKKKGGKAPSIQPIVNENISKTALRKTRRTRV